MHIKPTLLRAIFILLTTLTLSACGGGGGSSDDGDDTPDTTITAPATIDGVSYTLNIQSGDGDFDPSGTNRLELDDSGGYQIIDTSDESVISAGTFTYEVNGATGTLTLTDIPPVGEESFGILTLALDFTDLQNGSFTISGESLDGSQTGTLAEIVITTFTVTATADANGSISPASGTIVEGETNTFTVTPDDGFTAFVAGTCGGSLDGNTYTINAVTADCTVSATFAFTASTTPTLSMMPVKTFRFSWTDAPAATHYRVLENADGASGFTQVGADIPAGTEIFDHVVPLYKRVNAQYMLQSCLDASCNDSSIVSVSGTLVDSIGYVKASNTGAGDQFGVDVAVSGDGNTLAVGAYLEDGLDNGSLDNAGAVYIFSRSGSSWSEQARLTASNSQAGDEFGISVSLSDTGNTLAVGAYREDGNGVFDGMELLDNSVFNAGAVYVFSRSGDSWGSPVYIKANITDEADQFGQAVSLSGDGPQSGGNGTL